MNTPFFSIITVVFNDKSGFLLTLESIKSLNSSDYEWIVIDGNSSDGTQELVRAESNLMASWVSEPDIGIYDAMNKGMLRSSGKYIVFMNAGDIFPTPETLDTIKNHLSSLETEPDLLFGSATFALLNGRTRHRSSKPMYKYIWHGLPANHQATYFRRESLGDIQYDLQYRICGDYFLVATLFTRGAKAAYIDTPLVNFRIGDTSYRNPKKLLLEPYLIQRDTLHSPLHLRLISLCRRLIATLGIVILSSPLLATSQKPLDSESQPEH